MGEIKIPPEYQVKHAKLQNAVALAQQRLDIAQKQLDRKPTDHNDIAHRK